MNKQAHTPGPWHWEADPVKGDPYGRIRYQVTSLGKTVTRVYYSSFEGGPTNAEWDARLIAAAPDLITALQAIVDRYVSLVNCGDCGNWDPETEAEIIAARAVIAKATGSASCTTL